MVLSDRSIREALGSGRIVIEPLAEDALQPASVDIRLDRQFRVFRNHRDSYIDVRESTESLTELETVGDDEPFVLHPGEFVLGSTLERVTLGDDIVARIYRPENGEIARVIDPLLSTVSDFVRLTVQRKCPLALVVAR